MENKFGNMLSIFLIIAIVIIVAILAIFGYRIYINDKTDKKSKDIATEFDTNIGNADNSNSSQGNDNSSNDQEGNTTLEDILNNLGNNGDQNSIYQQQGKKDTYYQGYKVIGTISIPSINVAYPILEENTADTLKIAIVAIYPDENKEEAINKPGNVVLWGHNYKNGTFFSDIGKLTTGAKIYIKDTSGKRIEYQVYNIYETTDSDFTYATRNTDGAREISLSTCTNDASRRTIIWARETK